MFKHYLITAWRNFLRYKLITSINVLGLTLGLACFFVALSVFIYFNASDRSLPNSDRVVMVWQRITVASLGFNGPFFASTSEAVGPTLRREFPEIEAIAQIQSDRLIDVVVEDRRVFVDAAAADPNYLDVLDLPRVQVGDGNPLAMPHSVVLSTSAAQQLFNSTDVLGRRLKLRGLLDVTVAAVLKPLSTSSHLAHRSWVVPYYDILYSFDTQAALSEAIAKTPPRVRTLAEQWGPSTSTATYLLLPKKFSLSAEEFESKLQGLPKRYGASDDMQYEFRVVPLTNVLRSALDATLFLSIPGLTINSVLVLLGVVVLTVACANYAHLSFAQANARLRETGLRRSIGASRSQLAAQAFIESTLHILLALSAALTTTFIVGSIIEARFGYVVLTTVFGSGAFWSVSILATACVAILIAVYSAFTLSRVKPAQAIQAKSQKGRFARLLLGGQFSATGALLVIVMVAFMQNKSLQQKALQLPEDPIVVFGERWEFGGAPFSTWRTELGKSPAVRVVSASHYAPWTDTFINLYPLQSPDGGGVFNAILNFVDYDYDKAVGLKIVAGRSFDRQFSDVETSRSGKANVVIDESLSRHLGYANPHQAISQTLRHTGMMAGAAPMTIVGVVQDKPLRVRPVFDFVGNAYLPGSGDFAIPTGFGVRRGVPLVVLDKTKIAEGLRHIDDVWRRLNPIEPPRHEFTDETFQRSYAFYSALGTALTLTGSIALLVSLLGALGFALFVGEQRAHEIGVRKTLGASAERILTMLLKDFSKPILIANLFAWPLAFIAVQKYLSLYLERVELTLVPFVASLAISLIVVWLAIGKQVYRAARMSPATVLRHE